MSIKTKNKINNTQIDITRIMSYIPHRYPFLLVDKILDIQKDFVLGLKNVSINEHFFQGHFPGKPVMPGVLLVESMAQTSAVFVVHVLKQAKDKLVYFMTLDGVKFRKPVVPGDSLIINVKVLQNRLNVWKFSGKILVDNVIVCEAIFSAMIVDRDE